MTISRRQMLAGMAGFVAAANVNSIAPECAFAGAKMERFAQKRWRFFLAST